MMRRGTEGLIDVVHERRHRLRSGRGMAGEFGCVVTRRQNLDQVPSTGAGA